MTSLLHTLLENLRQITVVEAIAVVATFVSVFLTMRNHIATWFWGLVAVLAYGYFFYQQRNFGNAGLNLLYFVPIQIYGWYAWLRFGPKRQDDLPVTTMSSRSRILCAAWTLGLSVLAVCLLRHFTPDPYPVADGITTALSIVAQYLEVFKRIENWILWIVADVIYVFYLFPVQKDYLSTLLYVALLAMCVIGLRRWRALMRQEPAPGREATAADA